MEKHFILQFVSKLSYITSTRGINAVSSASCLDKKREKGHELSSAELRFFSTEIQEKQVMMLIPPYCIYSLLTGFFVINW